MKIAVFDSGIGGLTVLKEIEKELKGHEFLYLADTKRVPYGNRTNSEIIEFSTEIINFFNNKNVDLIIIACNTVNSVAFDKIKEITNIPIIGIMDAGILSLEDVKENNVLILATNVTVQSHKYLEKIEKKYKKRFKVLEHACTNFVNLIENNAPEISIENDIKNELDDIINEYDNIILACTHFPLIEKNIKKVYNNKNILNPAKYITKYLKGLKNDSNENNKLSFFVTKDIYDFKSKAEKILNKEISNINLISLEMGTNE